MSVRWWRRKDRRPETLSIIAVALRRRERPHTGLISLKKTVCRRGLNPVQKLGVIGAVRFAR